MPLVSQKRLGSAAVPAVGKRGWISDARVIDNESDLQSADDDLLLMRAGTGDQRAFRVLVSRHLQRSISLARRMTGNATEAEDVAQEAFLRVWQKASAWRSGDARFSTWLYRVVVNLCLDRRRKKPMAPLEAAGDPSDPSPSVELKLVEDQKTRMVTEALATLPDRQRTALVLSYYEEMSNIAAAEVLGVSVSALESLLVRARKALRAELDRHHQVFVD
jgi:RNA polymerase sigma-70 factor (ECF subfamily)